MDPRFDDPLFLQRTLSELAQGFAALAGAVRGPGGGDPPPPKRSCNRLRPVTSASSRRPGFAAAAPTATPAAGSGAAWARYQRAAARSAELASAIALEASRRLAEALAQTGPAGAAHHEPA